MERWLENTHESWHVILRKALTQVDATYLNELSVSTDWLPGIHHLFAAFSLPLSETSYILLGESPYPRADSANGYAFWDNAVSSLWSKKGLSKEVNRATSLRNILKMLLLARGDLLASACTQEAIALLDKSNYIQTLPELFSRLMSRGFLLLNASLVYSENKVSYHARHWRPFIHYLLEHLAQEKLTMQLVLLGRIADQVPKTTLNIALKAEHPYNLSFITQLNVLQFFKPMDLLGLS